MASFLEVIMLVCFGFSWPMAALKNYRSGTANGMNFSFYLLISIGYIAGIGAKIISGQINFVLAVYFLNLIFVALNLVIYHINAKKDSLITAAGN